MINYIWAGMMLISVVFAMLTGRASAVSGALIDGAQTAVELCITLLSSMCLWGGLMRIAENAGLTKGIARLFRPALRLLFPGLNPDSAAARAICMNVSANILGLGNAATPFGLEAMKQLKNQSPPGTAATNHMITFVVMNTASLQLIPTTVAAMRRQAGAVNPMDIMPAIWIASAVSLAAGLALTGIFNSGKGMTAR